MTAAALDIAGLNRFSFGDSPELANRLAALVVAGRKTGTCSAAIHGPETEIGQRHVVLDGRGQPVAVIETIAYDRLKFTDVTPERAALEGEGDLSHAYWAHVHEAYYRREGTWALDMLATDMDVLFETFRLVETLDPDFASTAAAEVEKEIIQAAARGFIAGLHTESFGVGAERETRLAALIVAGRKQGSTTAGLQGQPTRMGRRKIVLDGAQHPIALIRTVNYEKLTFDRVTDKHARLEGEGDLSLGYWRDAQERHFRKHLIFKPDLSLWFDTFELEAVLDEDFAAAAPAHVAAEIAEARALGFNALDGSETIR